MTEVEIGNDRLITSKEAAELSGYSTDYIARLAREEKIVGSQLNRQWYIDRESLERFLSSTAVEKEARSQKLQEERRKERTVRQQLDAQAKKAQQQEHSTHSRLEATVGAGLGALLCILVLVSAVSLYSAEDSGATGGVATASLAPNHKKDGGKTIENKKNLVTPRFINNGEVEMLPNSIFLSSDESATSINSTTTSHFFSDPVSVSVNSRGLGQVAFKKGSTTSIYPFLFIPASANSEGQNN